MIFLASLRGSGIADGAHELVEPEPMEPLACPAVGLSGAQVTTHALDHQAPEPPRGVAVDLVELAGSVPGTEVVPPATQDRVELQDYIPDVPDSGAVTAGLGLDLLTDALHRALAGPAVQVVAANAALQDTTRDTRVEVAA